MLPILLVIWLESYFYFHIVILISIALINETINLSKVTFLKKQVIYIKFLIVFISTTILLLKVSGFVPEFIFYLFFIAFFLVSYFLFKQNLFSFFLLNLINLSCFISVIIFLYDPSIILYLIIINSVSDISAYLFGSILKGPKIVPNISPNKTISGSVFALVFSILASVYLQLSDYLLINVILGFLISLFGQTGDVIESMYKRKQGVKDSGNLIPGHGGFLDRFDSLLLSNIFIFVPVYLNVI
mgnify:CR=1 FL=1|tara:strand:- start:706 stop:1434 length:729 start_codon:yes stop_codon:yes gene_type:complete